MPKRNISYYLKIAVIGYGGAFLLWSLRKTLRIQRVKHTNQPIYWIAETPAIVVFWHGHQLMMPWLYIDSKSIWGKKPMYALISQSQDGRFIAKAMDVLGIKSIAGSSSRGGKEALVKLVRTIKEDAHVAITPDGPKGPMYKVKVGALKVAQLTGARILPSCVAASRYWTFGSWDKMILPKPFSRAVIMFGDPIYVPREASESEVSTIALSLETELNRITLAAQTLAGNG